MAFESDPLKGLLLGLGIALTIAVVTETFRHLRRRRREAEPADISPHVALDVTGATVTVDGAGGTVGLDD